ncbi:unnamed protein product [Urochloa decumbens]|uniref:Knottin scorpion toxin-like domain-containing protein n=1 Tax=Urochloa decumbens TaxID=240449 RepID=A0ABC9B3C8_9POAL
MAPSRLNLSAVLLVVVVIVMASARESVSAPAAGTDIYDDCPSHLSANFKGACFFNEASCQRTCIFESSFNFGGFCDWFQCYCQTRCSSSRSHQEALAAAAAASAPI